MGMRKSGGTGPWGDDAHLEAAGEDRGMADELGHGAAWRWTIGVEGHELDCIFLGDCDDCADQPVVSH
jgi:hypothetical protein